MVTVGDTRSRVFLVSHDYGRWEATDDLVTVTTSKGIIGSGGWNILLIPKRTINPADVNYARDFRPNDWVEIWMSTDRVPEQLVMWGPISQVMRTRSVTASGAVVERIAMSGMDWTHMLEVVETIFDPLLAGEIEYPKIMELLAGAQALNHQFTAAQAIKALTKEFLRFPEVLKQYKLPPYYVFDLVDILDLDSVIDYPGLSPRLLVADYPTQMGGSLMSGLEYFADRANNYFFGDVKQVQFGGNIGDTAPKWNPALFLDRLPYYDGDLYKLAVTEVHAERDVVQEVLGRSDHDIRNWFRASPEFFGVREDGLAALGGPIINRKSVARHGIRRLTTQTPYSYPPTEVGAPTINSTTIPKVLYDQLWQQSHWYNANELLWNGTLQCRLLPKARVNQRLDYTDDYTGEHFSFYIEQVAHHWQYAPPSSSTMLSVTRGFPMTEEFMHDMAMQRNALDDASPFQGESPTVEMLGPVGVLKPGGGVLK